MRVCNVRNMKEYVRWEMMHVADVAEKSSGRRTSEDSSRNAKACGKGNARNAARATTAMGSSLGPRFRHVPPS